MYECYHQVATIRCQETVIVRRDYLNFKYWEIVNLIYCSIELSKQLFYGLSLNYYEYDTYSILLCNKI